MHYYFCSYLFTCFRHDKQFSSVVHPVYNCVSFPHDFGGSLAEYFFKLTQGLSSAQLLPVSNQPALAVSVGEHCCLLL